MASNSALVSDTGARPFFWSWFNIRSLLVHTYNEWSEDDAQFHGAALSYFTVLSIAPLLIVVVAIAGLFFGEEAARGQIFGQVRGMVGTDGATAIEGMIEGARQPAAGILASVVGLVTLLFGASSVVAALQKSLNVMWDVAPKPDAGIKDMVKQRSYAVAVVLGCGFLLLVSLVISSALTALDSFVQANLPIAPWVLRLINIAVSFAVVTGIFALMFKFLPDVSPQWDDVLLGAAFTAVLFTIGKYFIGLYLGNASFGSSYGAAGSLLIVLVWVYYSSQIFFFGAEFTQVYAHRHGSDPAGHRKRKTAKAPSTGASRETVKDATAAPAWMAYGSPAVTGNTALPPVLPVTPGRASERSGVLAGVGALLGFALAAGTSIKAVFRK